MSETVFERCIKCISNGVITKTRVVVDEATGKPVLNDQGRVTQEPVDPTQATVWQCQYRQRGSLNPNIEFPENPAAESFEEILTESQGTMLYQMHHPLLDKESNRIPLDRDPSKFQHGDYMLVLVCPPPSKRDDKSPRDNVLGLIREKLPDLFKLSSICTGEAMVKALGGLEFKGEKAKEQKKAWEQNIADLFSRLTYPVCTMDRLEADPDQCIFIRADSGFDGLYVNAQTSARRRQAAGSATLPADSEPADVFGTGDTD
jgi:hypothetical protein